VSTLVIWFVLFCITQVVIDFVVIKTLGWQWFNLGSDIIYYPNYSLWRTAYDTFVFMLILVSRPGASGIFLCFFYAGFFTSLWALLYLTSTIVARALLRLRTTLKRVVWFFDVRSKPLQCIGYIAGIIAGVTTWVVTVML